MQNNKILMNQLPCGMFICWWQVVTLILSSSIMSFLEYAIWFDFLGSSQLELIFSQQNSQRSMKFKTPTKKKDKNSLSTSRIKYQAQHLSENQDLVISNDLFSFNLTSHHLSDQNQANRSADESLIEQILDTIHLQSEETTPLINCLHNFNIQKGFFSLLSHLHTCSSTEKQEQEKFSKMSNQVVLLNQILKKMQTQSFCLEEHLKFQYVSNQNLLNLYFMIKSLRKTVQKQPSSKEYFHKSIDLNKQKGSRKHSGLLNMQITLEKLEKSFSSLEKIKIKTQLSLEKTRQLPKNKASDEREFVNEFQVEGSASMKGRNSGVKTSHESEENTGCSTDRNKPSKPPLQKRRTERMKTEVSLNNSSQEANFEARSQQYEIAIEGKKVEIASLAKTIQQKDEELKHQNNKIQDLLIEISQKMVQNQQLALINRQKQRLLLTYIKQLEVKTEQINALHKQIGEIEKLEADNIQLVKKIHELTNQLATKKNQKNLVMNDLDDIRLSFEKLLRQKKSRSKLLKSMQAANLILQQKQNKHNQTKKKQSEKELKLIYQYQQMKKHVKELNNLIKSNRLKAEEKLDKKEQDFIAIEENLRLQIQANLGEIKFLKEENTLLKNETDNWRKENQRIEKKKEQLDFSLKKQNKKFMELFDFMNKMKDSKFLEYSQSQIINECE